MFTFKLYSWAQRCHKKSFPFHLQTVSEFVINFDCSCIYKFVLNKCWYSLWFCFLSFICCNYRYLKVIELSQCIFVSCETAIYNFDIMTIFFLSSYLHSIIFNSCTQTLLKVFILCRNLSYIYFVYANKYQYILKNRHVWNFKIHYKKFMSMV